MPSERPSASTRKKLSGKSVALGRSMGVACVPLSCSRISMSPPSPARCTSSPRCSREAASSCVPGAFTQPSASPIAAQLVTSSSASPAIIRMRRPGKGSPMVCLRPKKVATTSSGMAAMLTIDR